jgi:ribosomal protein L11 methyltransferase
MPIKTWLEVECIVPSSSEESISATLMDLGAIGAWSEVSTEKGSTIVCAYFDKHQDGKALHSSIKNTIQKTPSLACSHKISLKRIEDADWLKEWKKHHEALRIGKSLHILPVWWETVPADGTVVRIDPGMAFGTGSHSTTKLCLAALEEIISEWEDPAGLSFLDMGCGSGILAITALKLGAGEATGVDNDPEALENALRNADINCVRPTFLSSIPQGKKFDLIVSNILAETHIQLKEKIIDAMKQTGRLVLSGILCEKSEMVSRSYKESGFFLEWERTEGEWSCLCLNRNHE